MTLSRFIRQEKIEIEAELLPEAFNKAVDACCSRFAELDFGTPVRARVEFYGAKMLLTQTEKNQHGIRGVERRLVYTFLLVYEDS